MKRLMLVLCTALALAVAVPAALAASRSYSVRAAGTVKDMTTNTYAKFQINLRAGPGHKIVYTNPMTNTNFRALHLTSWKFSADTAKFNGVGLVNGERVPFQVIAVAHPRTTGVFKIAWNGMAGHGGNVTFGRIRVTQISAS